MAVYTLINDKILSAFNNDANTNFNYNLQDEFTKLPTNNFLSLNNCKHVHTLLITIMTNVKIYTYSDGGQKRLNLYLPMIVVYSGQCLVLFARLCKMF